MSDDETPSPGKIITDRDFWIAVRAALLAIVSAIEKRWNIKPKQ